MLYGTWRSVIMTWDEYFLSICNAVGENSKCLSRKIGAILVRDKKIFSTGYNGPPPGMKHCDERFHFDEKTGVGYKPSITCPRILAGYKSGQGLHMCVASHAERNTILNAASLGIPVKGSTMYMNCDIPCKDCLIEIIRAEIDTIVCTNFDYYDELSKKILQDPGVKLKVCIYELSKKLVS